MNEERKTEIDYAVTAAANAVVEKLDERLDGRFTRVHQRIDPLVEDVAKIEGRLSLFPTPTELDEKIDKRIKECKENHWKLDSVKSSISKKDWLKIILFMLFVLATSIGAEWSDKLIEFFK